MSLKPGRRLFLALALALSGCRKDPPPPIEVCTHDAHGGGECSEVDQSRKYRPPSEMTNYWCTGQVDAKKLLTWCYNP